MGCNQKPKESVMHVELVQPDTTIFFFDIKQYSRGELAHFIEKISLFEPSVIAIHAVFPLRKDFKEDSIFQQSIVHSGRVIFCARINDDETITHSNSWFLESALDEGVNSYLGDENMTVRQYQPLFQGRYEGMVSFPDKIAYHHNPLTLGIFEKFKVNEIVEVSYTKMLSDFQVLNIDSLSIKKIKGKIILLADLTPTEFNEQIPDKNGNLIKAPSILITANIVLARLNALR